jgi:hypothetical protein
LKAKNISIPTAQISNNVNTKGSYVATPESLSSTASNALLECDPLHFSLPLIPLIQHPFLSQDPHQIFESEHATFIDELQHAKSLAIQNMILLRRVKEFRAHRIHGLINERTPVQGANAYSRCTRVVLGPYVIYDNPVSDYILCEYIINIWILCCNKIV